MKLKLLPFFLVALTTLPLVIGEAGEIRGTLKQAGQPVPAAKVEVVQGSNKSSSTTDASGFYRVFVPKPEQCTVTVVTKDGQTASTTVQSFDRTVQYDLMLEAAAGHYNLIVK